MFRLKHMIFAMTFCLFLIMPTYAYADVQKVYVRIESYNKTLADGEVFAENYLEAVQKIGQDQNIPIIISQTKNKKSIFSVASIKNNYFSKNDCWLGFIIRNGKIFTDTDILNTKLNANDEIVLYYGDSAKTKVLSSIKQEKTSQKLTIYVINSYVSWSTVDGKTYSSNITEGIQNARVHLKNSDGTEQIVSTDSEGKASFNIYKADWYTYFADGYTLDLPVIVKTSEKEVVLGIEDETALTRGEFASLIISKKQKTVVNSNVTFDDTKNHKYEKEIREAVSQGILRGYSKTIFDPDKNISILEAACVLSRFYPLEENFIRTENVPEWAQKSIYTAKKNGILNGINENLTSQLSEAAFTRMINNMN